METASGRPAVLVPGMLCDAELWGDAELWSEAALWADCDITAVPVSITEPDVGGMAEQVLTAVRGPFVLIGLSLGAIVAFEVLRRAPERVLALCAMSTNAGAPTPAQHAAWQDMRQRTEAGGFDDVVRRTLRTMFSAPEPPPEHAERYLAMAHRIGPDVFTAQLAAQATRIDQLPTLRGARCPVLAVCGDRDALCPVDFHRAIADAAPSGQLRVLPGAGHLLPIERPREIADLLRGWVRRSVPA